MQSAQKNKNKKKIKCSADLFTPCFHLSVTSLSTGWGQAPHQRPCHEYPVTWPQCIPSTLHALCPGNITGCWYHLVHIKNALPSFILDGCFFFIGC